MSRRSFIEQNGATCRNWQWSWSFINEEQKFIIFGAWDHITEGNISLIFSKKWQVDDNGKKKPGYKQSREHIRLIEEEGFDLMTFPLIHSDERKDKQGKGPAKIKGFIPKLSKKTLKRVGENWYSSDDLLSCSIPEEVGNQEQYFEGSLKTISVNTYERSAEARKLCIEHFGYKCSVCDFSFKSYYGDIGENFIHVHHIVPLSEIGEEYSLNPVEDLIPVCANCHAIIHRTRPALSVEELKEYLKKVRNST